MTAKQIFYKVRPFLGLIIMVLLFLLCSALVFFSVFSILWVARPGFCTMTKYSYPVASSSSLLSVISR